MTDAELLTAAEKQLRANLRQGRSAVHGGKRYSFCVPSNVTYPFQWFWDSCKHAIVWTYIDVGQAKEELLTLVRAQRRNGRIPHRIAWEPMLLYPYRFYLHSTSFRHPVNSRLVDPPVLAQAVERVYQRSGDRAFLERIVPRVDRFHRWLEANRDPDGDGLLSIIHPYESGLDHKPSFDIVFGFQRPNAPGTWLAVRWLDLWNRLLSYNLPRIFRFDRFNVEDTLFNCLHVQGLESLGRLWRELGDQTRAAECESRARLRAAAVLAKMRGEDGLYYDLYSRHERMALVKTVAGLFPLVLEATPKEEARRLVRNHLTNEREFWLPYPVPTVAADDPSFNPSFQSPRKSGLWRGPTWVSTSWFLLHGLLRHGFKDEAKEIAARTRRLVEAHGFREFYNPYTGEAYGAPGFAWSTLVVDMIAAVKGA